MTIQEAIKRVDDLVPNDYSRAEKINWLSTLDGMLVREVLSHYEGGQTEFSGYDKDTDTATELIITAPYDELYILWLESKIDFYNQELDRYNNSAVRFDDVLQSFKQEFNRTHTHKRAPFIYC